MKAVLDIETDSLTPNVIHLLVIKNVETGGVFVYTSPPTMEELSWITEVIGHNIIKFDLPVLKDLWGIDLTNRKIVDTLILSHMLWYKINGGHSLKTWGERLQSAKSEFNDWSKLSQAMIDYCIQDVELNHKLYDFLMTKLGQHVSAIQTEMDLASLCHKMSVRGFPFDAHKAKKIQSELSRHIAQLDKLINECFLPVANPIQVITPFAKADGTLAIRNLKWYEGDLSDFTIGAPMTRIVWEPFNPSSPKQVCERLWEAGWKPTDKTDGHLVAKSKEDKEKYKIVGWKINENNLSTLPEDAPEGARALVRRMMLETRTRKIAEWLNSYNRDTGNIHGTFNGIGTWTHRMSHTEPNMANIAAAKSIKYNSPSLNKEATYLGGLFRRLWRAPKGKALIGCDAEGIQLRVLAHYMNDPKFVFAVTQGNKKDGTDPHTLNMKALGSVCKTRDNAKTFKLWRSINESNSGKLLQGQS